MKRLQLPLVLGLILLLYASIAAASNPYGEAVRDAMPLGQRPGNPADHLPQGTTLISSFGERPVFSPDGRKLAFIGESYGDAFEYDLASGTIRNLTGHMPHGGFLRIHYLPDGSYVLLGPHERAEGREATRLGTIELWWMDARASRPMQRLRITVFEGVATSRESHRIAWAEVRPGSTWASLASGATIKLGEVVVEGGRARVANVRPIVEVEDVPGCMIEAQDFLPGDRGLTFPCYRFDPKPGDAITRVLSVDFATGSITTYPTPLQLFGEVEGIFPDGRHTLVECSGDRSAGMDLCMLELVPEEPSYTRLTRIMDFGRWKYGNPVVSPDGRTIAAQIGSADVIEAGVGQGIVLMRLPEPP